MSCSIFDSESLSDVNWFIVGKIPGRSNLDHIEVPVSGLTVGRRATNVDIVLPSSFVSNRHAILRPCGVMLEVRDLDSRNGTFVERSRIQGSALAGDGDTVAFADVEFRVEMTAQRAPANDTVSHATIVGSESFTGHWKLSNFTKLVQDRLVTPFVQPIVDINSGCIVGLESLARSEVPGLETPAKMFEAAELLEQAPNLSAICRSKAIEAAHRLPATQRLFLNTHPAEQLNKDLLRSVCDIRERFPALRLVIEVHEDLVEELAKAREFSRELAKHGVELALDDFGSGLCRMNEILRLRPDFVKFDRSMISGIDRTPPAELQAISLLIESLKSLSIRCVAEGIEHHAEAAVCRQLGFELAQGFHFAYPATIDSYPLNCGTCVEAPQKVARPTPITAEYVILADC